MLDSRNQFVFFQMMIARKKYPVRFEHPAEFDQDPVWFVQIVQDIEQEHDINASIRKAGVAISFDEPDITEMVSGGDILDIFFCQRMNVGGIDNTGRPDHLGHSRDISSGAAPVIEYTISGFDIDILDDFLARRKVIPDPENERHAAKIKIGLPLAHGFIPLSFEKSSASGPRVQSCDVVEIAIPDVFSYNTCFPGRRLPLGSQYPLQN